MFEDELYFLRKAAARTKCKRLGVGCMICVVDGDVIKRWHSGFNKPTAGWECNGVPNSCGCTHAELVAVYNLWKHVLADMDNLVHLRQDHDVDRFTTLLTTAQPCIHCASFLMQFTKITNLYCIKHPNRTNDGLVYLEQNGVTIETFDLELFSSGDSK